MKTLLIVICGLIMTACAGGVSNIQTATENELYQDLKLGPVFYPPGHQNKVRQELKRRHPEYAWHIIDTKNISTGMTKEEVVIAWGYPGKVNKSSYGQQWIYGTADAFGHRSYVYFKGNICTGWQMR